MAGEGCDSGAEEGKRWRDEEEERMKRRRVVETWYLQAGPIYCGGVIKLNYLSIFPSPVFSIHGLHSLFLPIAPLSLVAPIDLSPPRRSPLPLAPPHYISALQWAAEKEREAQQSVKWCELLLQLAAFDRIPQPAIATVTRSNMALW